jgi:hypothetical protein
MNQKNITKIFVLSDLLLQELDCTENEQRTEIGQELKVKCESLIQTLEPIVERFYQSKGVSKTTFYLTLQNKINYIFNKEIK